MTSEKMPPDAGAVAAAASRLTEQLAALLDSDPRPADMPELAALAGQLVAVTDHVLWARDAALHAARRADAHWRHLTEGTGGIADSTLSERERTWLRRRRVPPAPLVTRSD